MRNLLSVAVLAVAVATAAAYPVSGVPSAAAPMSAAPGSVKLVDDVMDSYDVYPDPEPGYYQYNFGYQSFDDCQSDGYIIRDELGFSPSFYCASGSGPYALYLQWTGQ